MVDNESIGKAFECEEYMDFLFDIVVTIRDYETQKYCYTYIRKEIVPSIYLILQDLGT